MTTEQAIAVLARAILELASKAAEPVQYDDGSDGVSAGVTLTSKTEDDLRSLCKPLTE